MAHIEIIQHEKAEGRLKEIYDEVKTKRGKLAEVHKIQSLHPESIVKHIDLYLEIMFSDSPLTRAQREMIAVVVSHTNQCPYCVNHHSQALFHLWKDKGKISMLTEDIKKSGLSEQDFALCIYAIELTKKPHHAFDSIIEEMKQAGLSDHAILDAAMVIAYFNFVNRIVQGLGVELEQDGGTGYNY